MHVVLPEIDGRLFAGVVSFKSAGQARSVICNSRISRIAPTRSASTPSSARAAAWRGLVEKPAGEKRLAVVLSNYPGRPHQIAHAVGLDALASAEAMLSDLRCTGFDVGHASACSAIVYCVENSRGRCRELSRRACRACRGPCRMTSPTAGARRKTTPSCARRRIPFRRDSHAAKPSSRVQPERGETSARDADYHDLSRTPRHAYVAFYLWLRAARIDALIHMGAHGTLEWLPGKSVALSASCWPEALIGATAGHLSLYRQRSRRGRAGQTPHRRRHDRPSAAAAGRQAAVPAAAAAAGAVARRIFDRRRPRSRAPPAPDRRDPRRGAHRRPRRRSWPWTGSRRAAEAIPRIDRFVCDLKESQFGDGLHVFGRGVCGEAERDCGAIGTRRPTRRARAGRFALARTPRRAADRPQSVRGRSSRGADAHRRMRRASSSPRNCCAGTCRTMATGRKGWWSISGARRRCAPPARNLRWRCIWPASRRAGTTSSGRVIGFRDHSAGANSAGRAST